jgi:hypothetical protein
MPRAASVRRAPSDLSAVGVHTIPIEKKQVVVKVERVALSTLKLDPKNPRLRRQIATEKLKGSPTTKQLAEFIYNTFRYARELFQQIRDNGGIVDPVHITHDNMVVEGNCRVACQIKLAELQPNAPEWKTVPVWRLPPNITSRQIKILQGNFHVSPKNRWEAYARAGHLFELHFDEKMSFAEIAKNVGMREPVVERLVNQYSLITREFLPRTKDSDGSAYWSFVDEFYKRRDLKEFRGDEKNIRRFVQWVLDGKIPGGVDVRNLGAVVGSRRAMDVLERDGIRNAVSVAAKKDPTVDSTAYRQIEKATETLKTLAGPDLLRLKTDDGAQSLVRELHEAAVAAARVAKFKL